MTREHFQHGPAAHEGHAREERFHLVEGSHVNAGLNLLSIQNESCHSRAFAVPLGLHYGEPGHAGIRLLPLCPPDRGLINSDLNFAYGLPDNRYREMPQPGITFNAPIYQYPLPECAFYSSPAPLQPCGPRYQPYDFNRAARLNAASGIPPGYFNEPTEQLAPAPPYFAPMALSPQPLDDTDGGGPETRSSLSDNQVDPFAPATPGTPPEAPEPTKTEAAETRAAETKAVETTAGAAAAAEALAAGVKAAEATAGGRAAEATANEAAAIPLQKAPVTMEPPIVAPETAEPTTQPAQDITETSPAALPARESAAATSPLRHAEAPVVPEAHAVPEDHAVPQTHVVPDALKPMVNIWSSALNPSTIDANADPFDQKNRAYNPLAPLGLTEGNPGFELNEIKAGVMDRTVKMSGDKTSDETKGELDDSGCSFLHNHLVKPDGSGLDWNRTQTDFTAKDTFQDNKLGSRITTYSTGISMNFQTENPGKSIHIDGVTKVESRFDPSEAGYNTIVTGANNKKWTFTSDQNGVVMGVQGPT